MKSIIITIMALMILSGCVTTQQSAPVSDTTPEQKAVDTAINNARQIPSTGTTMSTGDHVRLQSLIDGAALCNSSLSIKTAEALRLQTELLNLKLSDARLQTQYDELKKVHRFDWLTDIVGDIGAWWRGFSFGAMAAVILGSVAYAAFKMGRLRI